MSFVKSVVLALDPIYEFKRIPIIVAVLFQKSFNPAEGIFVQDECVVVAFADSGF